MLEASLKILRRDPDGFFVVVEEEGTDNFANSFVSFSFLLSLGNLWLA